MMDLETYLHNAVNAARQKTLANSDQLTLGEMILKLEPIIKNQEKGKKNREPTIDVYFDFEHLFPTGIESWRGIYAELALNFSVPSYNDVAPQPMSVSDFSNMLNEAVGKTFEGYKGGEFTMSKHTPVWVANYGNSGNTAVIDIVDADYEVLIMTGYRES